MLRTVAYAWEKGGTKQVVYRAADGHIHELFVSVGRSWMHADLTQLTRAPLPDADSAFAGYQWDAGGTKQVVYITSDDHIHELFVAVGGSWSHADLTQLTGAPRISNAVTRVSTNMTGLMFLAKAAAAAMGSVPLSGLVRTVKFQAIQKKCIASCQHL
jgi:hypothetical protein